MVADAAKPSSPVADFSAALRTDHVSSAYLLAAASESVSRMLSKTMPPDTVRSSNPTALIGCMLCGCSSTK